MIWLFLALGLYLALGSTLLAYDPGRGHLTGGEKVLVVVMGPVTVAFICVGALLLRGLQS